MTKPRPIIKNTTYLLTRRCSRRRFLLKPSATVNQVFTYCMGIAQQKYGLAIHAVCAMGNHYHLIATDTEGQLPKFMHWMHEFIAKNLNVHHGRDEAFWKPGSYNAVKLADYEAIVDKMVYTLNNPVAAGLVNSYQQWPGLVSRPESILGERWEAPRPQLYFSKNSKLNATGTVRFTPPPGVDVQAFARDVTVALAEQQALSRRETARKRQKALKRRLRRKSRRGRAALLRQATDRPTSPDKRGIQPRVACRDPRQRAEELRRLKAFEHEYRIAWLAKKAGIPSVVFPFGTYGLAQQQDDLKICAAC